jgi:hypothetical protein
MANATRQPQELAAFQHGRKSNFFVKSRRRSPPAFYGVPDATGDPAPVLVSAESIRPRMHVYDFDGTHVGQVKEVLDGMLLVGRRWQADVRVPLEQVLAVIDQRVLLTVSRT